MAAAMAEHGVPRSAHTSPALHFEAALLALRARGAGFISIPLK
jgi:hypothetical protein